MSRIAFLDYGTKVRDTITGCVGIVTAAAHYYDKSPNSYYVEGKDNNGKPWGDWFTAERIEVEKEENDGSSE